jgi:hypothetical protein
MKLYYKFFARELRHRAWLIAISFIVFVVSFHINKYTVGKMEYYYMLFALAACATLLHDDETDFLKIGYMQITKVFACRYIASVLSVAALPGIWLMIFTKERRALKALFAFVVTVFIITAMGAFFRVLLKSTATALFCSLSIYVIFLFSSVFGLFSPFASMSIANLQKFYINRFAWIFLSALLIAISCLILNMRDRYTTPERRITRARV